MLGPEAAHSPNAEDIAAAYWVMLALAAALVLAVNAALVVMLVRFRAARGTEPRRLRGRPRTQARIAAVLGVVAVALFVLGVVYTERAQDVEASGPAGLTDASPLQINAVGQQWIWRYEYPDTDSGASSQVSSTSGTFADVFSYEELVVPVDTTIDLAVESTDVEHRWWVPSLGGKIDAIPGQVNHTWFKADEEGVFDGQSAGFSGASYPAMRTKVRVVGPEEYQAWIAKQGADIKAAQAAVQEQIAAAGGPPGQPEGAPK
ncbi:MAG: cytochrome c oxidase subunit II [Solirubrobacterales bacterium]